MPLFNENDHDDIELMASLAETFPELSELVPGVFTEKGKVALEAARAKIREQNPPWRVRLWRWLTGKGRR
jgi:hypothetical protein